MALLLAWLLLATTPAALHAQSAAVDALSSSDTAEGTDAKLQALLDVLEDDQARTELIDKLHALSGAAAPSAEPVPAAVSLARQLAELTRDAAEEASALAGRVRRDIRGLGEAITDGRLSFSGLVTRHAGLIGTIVATFAVLAILRLLRRPLLTRMAAHAAESGVFGRTPWRIGTLLIDALAVLLAFAGGHGLALSVFGEPGRISVEQTLFLNGFLAVELVKAALRALISPSSAPLRFLPIGDRTAAFTYRRSSTIATTIGYGVLVAAQLVHGGVSPTSGRAVAMLAMIAALILALLGIWKLKALLADEALESAVQRDLTGRALAGLGQIWPYLASIYVIVIFVIGISRPAEALPFVLGATLRSVLAVAIGVALVIMIGKGVKQGVPLPSGLRSNLPQLGRRADRLLPNLLWALRLLVLIAVALSVIDAFDLV
ncbi:MAG: hypothetical protein OEU92_28280, partial [Alphaproteobacteria bacterium]|nr:hypothetical protein [Alphaproteobacteria bacterium]